MSTAQHNKFINLP